MARNAVVLAAGLGRRLGLFTRRLPKPLLPVAGTSMLERSLDRLGAAGVERATIVIGHLGHEIEGRFGREHRGIAIEYVRSDRYRSTNDVYSLWLAREHLRGDTIVVQADVVYDRGVLDALAAAPADGNLIAVARHRPDLDGTVVSLRGDGRVEQIFYAAQQGPGFDYGDKFKTMNVYLFRDAFLREEYVPALERFVEVEARTNECFENVLEGAIRGDRYRFYGVDCTALPWYEVDTHEDRRAAERLLVPTAARLDALAAEHGGYWRHDVTDHRLLSNPHFPPEALLAELRRHLRELVTQYPVGHRQVTEVAADAFDLDPDRLVVANGSSELIKSLVSRRGWRVAVPVPSFNEYENATPPDRLVRFDLPSDDFRLDVEAFAVACRKARVDLAVVVSPNNPTSIAVPADELRWLTHELARDGCRLLVDESFVDFCPDPGAATLEPEVASHPTLAILKSVSKVYGVGGLRLGYVVAGEAALAQSLRGDLPIWDINGFAEQFLRVLPRYRPQFEDSCRLVREERDGLHAALAGLEGVHAFPAHANYVFLRLREGLSARTVADALLTRHRLLVKDCGGKSMPGGDSYVRIASRTADENKRLAEAFADVLSRVPELV